MLLLAFTASAADKVTEVFTLDHQMSTHCEKKIKENLRFEKGVSDLEVSLQDNTITITYNPEKTDTEKLIKGFKKIGFNAFLVSPENNGEENGNDIPADVVPCCGNSHCADCR